MDRRDSVTRGLEAAHDRAVTKKAATGSQVNPGGAAGAEPKERPDTDEQRPAQPEVAEDGGRG